jgi:hypothetical protein
MLLVHVRQENSHDIAVVYVPASAGLLRKQREQRQTRIFVEARMAEIYAGEHPYKFNWDRVGYEKGHSSYMSGTMRTYSTDYNCAALEYNLEVYIIDANLHLRFPQ